MPNEIPDSDEESDYESATRDALSLPPTVPESLHPAKTSNGGLDVNFDDFITQSAKEGSSPPEQTKRSTASTQRHLREALDNRRGSASSSYDGTGDTEQGGEEAQLPAAATGNRKRAHSEIDAGRDQRRSSQTRVKRTKTYGSSSRRHASSQAMERTHETMGMVDREQVAFPDAFAARSSSQAPQESDEEEDVVPQEKNRPRRIVSLQDDAASSVGHVFYTSNSSMGAHQSINLDFRESGAGLDINTNPFGALSQVSVDADTGKLGDERRAEISSTVPLSASPRRPYGDAISPLTDADFDGQPVVDMSTSVDPSVLTFEPPEESRMLSSPTTNTIFETATSTTTSHDVETAQQRAGTISMDYSANHTTSVTNTKKRSYKSRGSRQPSVASTEDELAVHRDPDAIAVGLPKEQYKPRPSKSRGGTVDPEPQSLDDHSEPPAKKKGRKKSIKSTANAAEEDSPVKLPTSELNLSDEAIIGLPKENYKPRPSRRRSRMVVEEEASIEVATNEEHIPSEQARASQHSQASDVKATPTVKAKKGRKAKVKRAKTSAAGLLKRSQPMISEGEEDVVWMDTKPAKVKLDLPADPLAGKAVKAEYAADLEAEATEKSLEASQEKKAPKPASSKTVTVEIPARVDEGKAEPKKRGRKPISVTVTETMADKPENNEELTTFPRAVHPQASSPPQAVAASKVLAEKDTNTTLPPPPTPIKQNASSSPSKPAKAAHSPINPAGGKVLYRVGLSRRSAIPPLLKIVKPPAKQAQQLEKENFDEEGKPIDLVAETMRKWREMGVLEGV